MKIKITKHDATFTSIRRTIEYVKDNFKKHVRHVDYFEIIENIETLQCI